MVKYLDAYILRLTSYVTVGQYQGSDDPTQNTLLYSTPHTSPGSTTVLEKHIIWRMRFPFLTSGKMLLTSQ